MLASSTPDALWSAPALRVLRPTGISCTCLRRGTVLRDCSLRVPVEMRLLVVSEPEESASALLRVLAGLSRPHAGHVSIAGLGDPSADGWGRRVAYLGPEPGIHSWMTPREAVSLAAGLLELAPPERDRLILRALRWVGIGAEADLPIGRGGPPRLQLAGLASALVGDPEVLLLDEPLRAVEAAARRQLLLVPGRRRTVVLASRYPASEAGLVSHVALLRAGRVALLAPVSELEAAGLPLSMRGITALADLRSSGAGASGVPGRAAVAR